MKLYTLVQQKIPVVVSGIYVHRNGKYWGIYQYSYSELGEREHKVGRDYRVKKLAVDYAYELAGRLGIDRSKVSIIE